MGYADFDEHHFNKIIWISFLALMWITQGIELQHAGEVEYQQHAFTRFQKLTYCPSSWTTCWYISKANIWKQTNSIFRHSKNSSLWWISMSWSNRIRLRHGANKNCVGNFNVSNKIYLCYNTKPTMARQTNPKPHGHTIHEAYIRLSIVRNFTYQWIFCSKYLKIINF